MKTLNNSRLAVLVSIFFLLAMVFSASYAYFTSVTATNKINYNTTFSAKTTTFTMTMKNNLTLTVNPTNMLSGGSANMNSTVSTDNVVLYNPNTYAVTCKYDIVYTPTTAITNSDSNASTLEFELYGTGKNGSTTVNTISKNLHNVSSATTVASNVSISATNATVTHTWTFGLKHYNLSSNQDANKGKTFGGKLTFVNKGCS